MVLKITIGFITGSLAILSSALDSGMDVVSSIINWLAIRKADASPTKEYTYGFGKIEGVVSLFQALLLLAIASIIAFFAIQKIIYGTELQNLDLGIGIMVISLIMTIFLVKHLKKTAKTTHSLILESETLHYETDIYSNAAILIGICIVFIAEWNIIDSLLSIIVSFYVGISALLLIKKAIQMLMDKAIKKDVQKKIKKIINSHKNEDLHGFHLLRTRQSGSKKIIDFHLVFRKNISLMEAHKFGNHIEKDILEKYPDADVLIHLDPYNDSKMEKKTKKIMKLLH